MFKVNNKTPEKRKWRLSGVSIVDFDQVNISWEPFPKNLSHPSLKSFWLFVLFVDTLPSLKKFLKHEQNMNFPYIKVHFLWRS